MNLRFVMSVLYSCKHNIVFKIISDFNYYLYGSCLVENFASVSGVVSRLKSQLLKIVTMNGRRKYNYTLTTKLQFITILL